MGRLIDADEVKKRFPIMENDFGMVINERLHKHLDEIPTVEAIPKDQYEARLKTDMVAMLTELKAEIEELKSYESADGQDLVMLADIGTLFQQKINALKEKE